jgi:heterotetrameric sarcosine oxidase delta subunit
MSTGPPPSPTDRPSTTRMLQITCPYCGPREEIEFSYGGQGVPLPAQSDDPTWGRVLYVRDSPAGPFAERWVHVHGCRRWFQVIRDTRTHVIEPAGRLSSNAPGQGS